MCFGAFFIIGLSYKSKEGKYRDEDVFWCFFVIGLSYIVYEFCRFRYSQDLVSLI